MAEWSCCRLTPRAGSQPGDTNVFEISERRGPQPFSQVSDAPFRKSPLGLAFHEALWAITRQSFLSLSGRSGAGETSSHEKPILVSGHVERQMNHPNTLR